jgi:protein-arginine kinase activator protein McsA
MKCQNCGRDEVNFFYSSNINGSVRETRLCAECAEKLGAREALRDVPRAVRAGFEEELLSSFFGLPRLLRRGSSGNRAEGGAESAATAAVAAPEAPAPAEIDEAMSRRRELNVLRERMRTAAEAEDFETAARLRDAIQKFE